MSFITWRDLSYGSKPSVVYLKFGDLGKSDRRLAKTEEIGYFLPPGVILALRDD